MTVLLLAVVGLAQAQIPANFAGNWTFDEARTAALAKSKPAPSGSAQAGQGGAVGLKPGDLVIRQSATQLIVELEAFDQIITATFALDGAESTNKSGAVTQVSRTRWAGKTLVTEGNKSQVTSQGYAAWKFKEVRSLDRAGAMVVETTSVATDGVVTAGVRVYTRKQTTSKVPRS